MPSGGKAKQWISGVVLAAWPLLYGIHCLLRGHATLFGRGRSRETLTGTAGISLAIAYIALGAFLHFHYFWGLSERLWRFSQFLKVVALLVFVSALFYALYRWLF